MNDLVSIIIPVFNVPEKYLRKSIESCIYQTYKNIQIILVDDGSTDGCQTICDKYEEFDSRITVIHQKNGGLSNARNTGQRCAKGKWITFVDGDDYLEKNAIEELILETQKEPNVDVVLSAAFKSGQKDIPLSNYDGLNNRQKYLNNDTLEQLKLVFRFEYGLGDVWGKLMKRSFLIEKEIFHDEDIRHGVEGIVFCTKLMGSASNVVFIKKYLYHYTSNPQSISFFVTPETITYTLKGVNRVNQILKQTKLYNEIKPFFYERVKYIIVSTTLRGVFNPKYHVNYSQRKHECSMFLKNTIINESLNEKAINCSFSRRIILFLLKFKLYRLVYIAAKINQRRLCR